MAMNKIQFPAGLSMRDFQRQYGTDAQCEAAVFALRWVYASLVCMIVYVSSKIMFEVRSP